MNCEPFISIAVDMAVFFGACSDEVLDPDVAVAQLEMIAARLQELGDADKAQLINYVNELATREEADSGTTDRTEFLRSFAENCGI